MRNVNVNEIKDAVKRLCIEANYYISPDIKQAFENALENEQDFLSKDVLSKLLSNAEIAEMDSIPICQDTGMAVVFIEVGRLVSLDGNLEEAINQGVAEGYEQGYLRKSVVKDPFDRVNTKDNTPAVIHYKITEGDKVKIIVAPKGFGSENMSALKMLKPSMGVEGVKQFIIETVKIAGPNPCPPILVGVGVGGTMEKAAIMAKEALLRPIGVHHENPFIKSLEQELLTSINNLNIGPAGFDGKTTALTVNINTYATHIAGLPVAVNIGCHVTRHKEAYI